MKNIPNAKRQEGEKLSFFTFMIPLNQGYTSPVTEVSQSKRNRHLLLISREKSSHFAYLLYSIRKRSIFMAGRGRAFGKMNTLKKRPPPPNKWEKNAPPLTLDIYKYLIIASTTYKVYIYLYNNILQHVLNHQIEGVVICYNNMVELPIFLVASHNQKRAHFSRSVVHYLRWILFC